MRLAGHEWSALVSEARLGTTRYRVVHPARPILHAALHESRFGGQLSVDKDATAVLATAWWLAARSPRSFVYLPLRSSVDCGGFGERKLDLVLLHHSLGFRVAEWKTVRAKLTRSKTQKVTMPPEPFRPVPEAAHEHRGHREFHDHLRWTIAADTLFVVGSRRAYEYAGEQVRALAEESPAELAEHPDRHHCAEIDLGRTRRSIPDARNPYATLHIECCNEHW